MEGERYGVCGIVLTQRTALPHQGGLDDMLGQSTAATRTGQRWQREAGPMGESLPRCDPLLFCHCIYGLARLVRGPVEPLEAGELRTCAAFKGVAGIRFIGAVDCSSGPWRIRDRSWAGRYACPAVARGMLLARYRRGIKLAAVPLLLRYRRLARLWW